MNQELRIKATPPGAPIKAKRIKECYRPSPPGAPKKAKILKIERPKTPLPFERIEGTIPPFDFFPRFSNSWVDAENKLEEERERNKQLLELLKIYIL